MSFAEMEWGDMKRGKLRSHRRGSIVVCLG